MALALAARHPAGSADGRAPAAPSGQEGVTPARVAPATPAEVAWDGLRWLWSRSTLPSVQACRRSLLPGVAPTVGVEVATGTGAVGYTGLRTCGSCHACPVCADAIWSAREADVRHLIGVAQREGLRVAMLTLTLRHRASDPLADLLAATASAWAAVGKARGWQKRADELGLVGVVRRLEITHGRNGWHPHLHVLVFADGDPEEDAWEQLRCAADTAWRAKVQRLGLRVPSPARGVHLRVFELGGADALDQVAAAYMTAAGTIRTAEEEVRRASSEVADVGAKLAKRGNRTVWGLLAAAMAGERRARAAWAEYEAATKGRQSWAVSTALRRLADEAVEVVAPERERTVVGRITSWEWAKLCHSADGPGALAAAVQRAYRNELAQTGEHAAALACAALALDDLLTHWLVRTE